MNDRKRSLIEKGAGSVVTESALTLVGALSGNPLGSLLPILTKSLASERQRTRVEKALVEVNATLNAHETLLTNLTDSQYKLISETILAFLNTIDPGKLAYLRNAVSNSLTASDLKSHEAIYLSRIIRDISAEEADFLVRNYSHQRLQLGAANGTANDVLVIPFGSPDELIVTSLISLGLVVSAGPTMDDGGLMRFAGAVAKVIALLRDPRA